MAQKQRRVIINGDDFGASADINQAIIQAYEQGILTSASLMVTGEAMKEAVEFAKANPQLGVGLHLVLVKGYAALPAHQIPNLVDARGWFPNQPFQLGLKYQFNAQARQELKQEIRAQLTRFQATGLGLTHVDGHKHLHLHPVVLQILAELSGEFGIKTIRLPLEELPFTLNFDKTGFFAKFLTAWVFGLLRCYGESLMDKHGVRYCDRIYGVLQTGKMSEAYLLSLIPQIQADLAEIYFHPSQSLSGELELQTLLSQNVRMMLDKYGFELTTYARI